ASPEGQLLIERIAQITSTGRRRGSVPPPAFPSGRPASLQTGPVPVHTLQPAQVAQARPAGRATQDSITDVRVPGAAPTQPEPAAPAQPQDSRWASSSPSTS